MAELPLELFEAAMPAAMRPLMVEDGRFGGNDCQSLLRGDPPLATEIVGWAAGMCLFDRNSRHIARIITRHAIRPPIPFVLEAIGVGVEGGLECPAETWKSLEPLVRLSSHVPRALLTALSVVPQAPTDPLLAQLLAAWAVSFDERLIAPITAAGAAQSATRGPLRAASKGELEHAWLAVAKKKDPGDVDRLLGTPWPGAWKLARVRVEALEAFPRDPRIAAGVRAHAARYTSWAGSAVGEAANRLARQMHQRKVGNAPEALLREAGKLTPHTVDLEALWKGFWADPRDAARRVVLADALQSAGDPRGEFISLQLAIAEGRADASAEKRAAKLLDDHIDSWSGSLPGVERASREFLRGFLVAVTLRPDREHLPKALDRPEWRTVERLGINYVGINAAQVGALLQRMPCLRALVFNQGLLESDTKRFGGPFPTVELIAASNGIPTRPLAAFPSLEVVCAYAKDPLVALQAAKKSGLKGVMLRSDPDVEEALRAFEKPSVQAVSELRLAPSMYSDCHPRSWMIRITRKRPTAAELFHSGRYEKGSFTALAKLLAAHGRTALHVHAPVPLKARLEAEPRGACTVTFSHPPVDVFLLPR